ncbi:MAG: HD domain-containing protein [Bacteriovoracaceae bacterium]|nr:HD domain-containing protein [Bacteriovoracaceae bacterium]
MALRVLLIDPDESWLTSADELFKKHLYAVDTVTNGKDAQIKMMNGKYFAVVMNYAVKNHTANQVLKFMNRMVHDYDPRVVIILEEEDLGDDDDRTDERLKKEGVDEILIKPFELEDLITVLEGHQGISDIVNNLPKRKGQSDEVEVDMSDDNFTKIKIDDFYSLKSVLYDIYVRLKSGRYIKILHSGDEFSSERLDNYKNEKGVEYLYFHVKDRKKYIKFNDHLVKKALKSNKMDSHKKTNMLKNVAEKFMEESFVEGLKPVIIEQGRQICENVYNLIEGEESLYKLLRNYQDFDPSAFSHAYLVTLFSSAIIMQFEWQSKTMIENTALACMFHDIGKMKLPKDILEVRPEDMNESQLAEYQKHPELGLEIVQDNRTITTAVKQIIHQHHEYFDGSGYPNALKGQSILTLANIVSLADIFSHIIVENNLKPIEALKFMLGNPEVVVKFNSMIFEKFINVFVDPGKVKKNHALPSNSRMVSSKKAS